VHCMQLQCQRLPQQMARQQWSVLPLLLQHLLPQHQHGQSMTRLLQPQPPSSCLLGWQQQEANSPPHMTLQRS
jgi:hypothetical protein